MYVNFPNDFGELSPEKLSGMYVHYEMYIVNLCCGSPILFMM